MRISGGPPPARWLRAASSTWLESAIEADSSRTRRFVNFSSAVSRLLETSLTSEVEAREVIGALRPTLGSCDSLAFESTAECLAYVCWHLIDRYGRVQHALDQLVAAGHLPVRRRPVTLLEVGSGPAPAAYAIADYYASFVEWCQETGQTVQPSTVGELATLDRGPAWGQVVHRLSEILLTQDEGSGSAIRTFGTSYADLRGFSVRRLHHERIAQSAEREIREAEWADEYLGDREARELALEIGSYPPSAYDLIVMCNFLTQPEMTSDLAAELSELTGSLTPGGVLLVLGSASKGYDQVYAAVDQLATTRPRHPLKRVLTDLAPLSAQGSQRARDLVANGIVRDLRMLRQRSTETFDALQGELPGDVQSLDPEQIDLPKFHLRAYKKEGAQAFTAREKQRMARRQPPRSPRI